VLVWVAKRLWHYMLYHTTWLNSKGDPLRYICGKPYLLSRFAKWQVLLAEYNIVRYIYEKPYLSSRIARWQVLLVKYDIMHMTRKVVKWSVIANNSIEDYKQLNFEFPDKNVLLIEEEEKMTNWKTIFWWGNKCIW
jgi:thiamine pyrophosphokinase